MVRAIRSGEPVEISIYDILAGDVLRLEPGDVVPADGVLISGYGIRCDESSMTGESDQVKKLSGDEVLVRMETPGSLEKLDPFIISGGKVLEGIGTYLVTGVGVNSAYGRLRMGLTERTEATPLQKKLSHVADMIATGGVVVAIILFLVLTIKLLIQLPERNDSPFDRAQTFLRIFIISITVVVIAVPEGLPLACTLALAIAVTRMLKDNNLVRILAACETMGNATTVCCDKTGTLTMNNMTVVAGTVGVVHRFANQESRPDNNQTSTSSEDAASQSPTSPEGTPTDIISSMEVTPTGRFVSSLAPEVQSMLVKSIATNTTAFLGEEDGKPTYIGSKTEAALLSFAAERLGMGPLNEERANVQVVQVFPFDSRKKCMATVTRLSKDAYRMYVKGAPEVLLENSTRILADASRPADEVHLIKERRDVVMEAITGYAAQSYRTLCLAYRDFPIWPPPGADCDQDDPKEVMFEDVFADLTILAVLAMQDPLRPDVPAAVALCQHAGVCVRMVTGDNVRTAMAIARQCGILTSGLVMEGPRFRKLSSTEMDDILPRLQVLARSSPEDKRLLVTKLKELGETVAVTGDGTNDGPALRAADVGFSMGLSGTEVTKEASSIVLMDDNFSSIVKAIEWGRTVNDAIKKFLQVGSLTNVTCDLIQFG